MKLNKIVARNAAKVEFVSTYEILRAMLHAIISKGDKRCNLPIARNIACNVAPCVGAPLGAVLRAMLHREASLRLLMNCKIMPNARTTSPDGYYIQYMCIYFNKNTKHWKLKYQSLDIEFLVI